MSYAIRCNCAAHPVLATGPDPELGEYECPLCGSVVSILSTPNGHAIVRTSGRTKRSCDRCLGRGREPEVGCFGRTGRYTHKRCRKCEGEGTLPIDESRPP